jgi:hypothetical protein
MPAGITPAALLRRMALGKGIVGIGSSFVLELFHLRVHPIHDMARHEPGERELKA